MGPAERAAVRIASHEAAGTWIRLSALPERYDDPNFTWLRAEACAGEVVRCSTEVAMGWFPGFGDGTIDEWFQTLADDWRGWDGERRWRSLENGLLIRARHVGNRVVLRFRLQPDARPPEWQVQVAIPVDPGEDLTSIAREVKALHPRGAARD